MRKFRITILGPPNRSLWLATFLVFLHVVCGRAQEFTTLYSFSEAGDGGFPYSTLTEAAPNVFVGTATSTIFSIGSTTPFSVLSTFPVSAGDATEGQLYPASNGLLYGSNYAGVGTATGSIFLTDASGRVKVLRTNPYYPSPLTEASDGNLYGVAASASGKNFVIFRMSPSGIVTPLYSLGPYGHVNGPLLQASDGNLYGSTVPFPTNGQGGIVFKISLAGEFTQIAQFGDYLGGQGGLIQASNGNIYGITYGLQPTCPRNVGSIFELTLSGQFETIYDLPNSCYPIGSGPSAGLIEASDGKLYGVTAAGGAFGQGSIFRISLGTPDYTTLENLDYPFMGIGPQSAGAGFVQGSDGAFYGTTVGGGTYQFGTVYRFDPGLPPPLPGISYFKPASAAPGSPVLINGAHLIGLTGISFNGVPATQITSRGVNYASAVVPIGATTGPITVTTANGSTTTKASFTVK